MSGKNPQLCPFTGLFSPFWVILQACPYFLEEALGARNSDFESRDKLLENVNDLYMRLQKSNDPDAFYSFYFSHILKCRNIFHNTRSFYCYSHVNEPSKTNTSRISETKRMKHHSYSKHSALDQNSTRWIPVFMWICC